MRASLSQRPEANRATAIGKQCVLKNRDAWPAVRRSAACVFSLRSRLAGSGCSCDASLHRTVPCRASEFASLTPFRGSRTKPKKIAARHPAANTGRKELAFNAPPRRPSDPITLWSASSPNSDGLRPRANGECQRSTERRRQQSAAGSPTITRSPGTTKQMVVTRSRSRRRRPTPHRGSISMRLRVRSAAWRTISGNPQALREGAFVSEAKQTPPVPRRRAKRHRGPCGSRLASLNVKAGSAAALRSRRSPKCSQKAARQCGLVVRPNDVLAWERCGLAGSVGGGVLARVGCGLAGSAGGGVLASGTCGLAGLSPPA